MSKFQVMRGSSRSVARAFAAAVPCLLLGFGCGNAGYGDAPGGSGLQVSTTRQVGKPQARVVLLVVDDRPEAAGLLAELNRALEAASRAPLEPQTQCRLGEDPGTLHPIDWSAVIVHPSVTGDALYTSAADDPALRWTESERTEAGRSAWVTAVSAALARAPEEPGPLAALAAFERAASLVTRQRTAESPAETALVDSLPEAVEVEVTLALAGDDESPGDATSYAVSLGEQGRLDTLVVPGNATDAESAVCDFAKEPAAPRLATWLAAQQASQWALWPCSGLTLFSGIEPNLDCARQCVDFRPLRTDDGSAACLVLVDSAADDCDESLGWLDPQGDDGTRRPQVTQAAGTTLRTCEIRQLTGQALASCRGELSCSECEPGWCLTDVAELQTVCARKRSLPIRFVGGADAGPSGLATLLCDATR